jgi:hypothetical protein
MEVSAISPACPMGDGLVSYLYEFLGTLKCKECAVPSPFPGMDPYLEGYLWPDVHSALAHTLRRQLAPQIQPKYVARLEISVIEDQSPAPPETPEDIAGAAVTPITAPLTIPLPHARLATVEIRDVAQNILVTSIEILSPVNKREPHLSQYRQKRERLRAAHVHLLEIDLLRCCSPVPRQVPLRSGPSNCKINCRLCQCRSAPLTQRPSWIYPQPCVPFMMKPFTISQLITLRLRPRRRSPRRKWPG